MDVFSNHLCGISSTYCSSDFICFFPQHAAGSTCPVKGQIYNQCKGCPTTCANYGQLTICPAICAPGCACLYDQVIDEKSNTCVLPEECPGKNHTNHLLANWFMWQILDQANCSHIFVCTLLAILLCTCTTADWEIFVAEYFFGDNLSQRKLDTRNILFWVFTLH